MRWGGICGRVGKSGSARSIRCNKMVVTRATFILAWCVLCGFAGMPTAKLSAVGKKHQDPRCVEWNGRGILAQKQGCVDSSVGSGGACRDGTSRVALQDGEGDTARCCFWGKEEQRELGERQHRIRMLTGRPSRLSLRGGRSERAPLIPSSGDRDAFDAGRRRASEALSERRCQSREMDLLAKRLASTRRMRQIEVVPAQDSSEKTEETTSSLPGGAGGWVVEPVQEGEHRDAACEENVKRIDQQAIVLAPTQSSSQSSSSSSAAAAASLSGGSSGRLYAGLQDGRRVAGGFECIEVVRVAGVESDVGDMRKILQSGSSSPGIPATFFRPERPCMELIVYRPPPLSTIEAIKDGPPPGEPCAGSAAAEDVGGCSEGGGGTGESATLMEED